MKRGIIYLIIPLLILNISFGAQIVKAWVYTNKGSSADAFEYSYKGPYYYYTYIYTQLDNGKVLKYCINLTDNLGTTCPAPTILLNYTLPNGTTVEVFEQYEYQYVVNGETKTATNTSPIKPLPYTAEIPIGTKLVIKMNDNYNDNNYKDGEWDIIITKNGLRATYCYESGGYFHNTSLVLLDNETNETIWNVPFPYKNNKTRIEYNFTLPTDGSNATVSDKNNTYIYTPPQDYLNIIGVRLKAPIPLPAIIIAILSIPVIALRRKF
jgi:hypothetical protein